LEVWRRGELRTLAESGATSPPRGWCVFLIGPPPSTAATVDEDVIDAALRDAFADGAGVRDAADAVSTALSAPRRRIYQRALAMRNATP